MKIQFYDGWWYLRWAATMDLPRYLIQFLDPANITQGYRPVQGLYIYLLYQLYGFNPDGYHLAHSLVHAASSTLLFLIVRRLGKNLRAALVAGIFYAVLPAYSLAVFWHAVVDPLAGFFYLLTVLLWTRYLATRRPVDWAMTFGAYLLALFSKEISVFLPLFLYLIEWWFYGVRPQLRQIRRYAPFLAAIIPYLWLVAQVQSHGEFVGQFGFKIGPHMLVNLLPYLAVLAFPWQTAFPADPIFSIWLGVVLVVYFYALWRRRHVALLLLALFSVLSISPLLGFPQEYFNPRYLYLPAISSAIWLGYVFERGWQFVRARGMWRVGAPALAAVLAVVSAQQIAQAAADLAEYTRQVRVPFNDIARAHPSFPADSYLYFVDSPVASIWDLEGLFFVRYGERVIVHGTEMGRAAELYQHRAAFVYYFDPTGKPIELPVDRANAPASTPAFPIRFDDSIALEDVLVTSGRLARGRAVAILSHWRPSAKIERNYSVFAHVVDAQGRLVSSLDRALERGSLPTSEWQPHRLVVDAIILPIPPDTPVGENYRLEIGLYESASGKRLSIIDANGQPIGDAVVIAPFSIMP